MPTAKPEDLDAAIAANANRYFRRGCSSGAIIAGLESDEFRMRLIEHLQNPDIPHTSIVRAVKETLGIAMRYESLRRHRLRMCTCSEETWLM